MNLWLEVGWCLLSGRERSVLSDSLAAFQNGRPVVRAVGQENIPSEDACLVVCNHYHRSGFDAWWIALGVSAAFDGRRAESAGKDIHWVMTSAWTFPENRMRAKLFTPLTRVLFTRLARLYGFISMPPMPPAPEEVQERAAAVLRTVRLARAGRENGVLIGLAPEGQDYGREMGRLPEGVGEYIALLVQAGLKVLPAGVYEEGEALVVSFGEVFVPALGEKEERDSLVAAQVMAVIRNLIANH